MRLTSYRNTSHHRSITKMYHTKQHGRRGNRSLDTSGAPPDGFACKARPEKNIYFRRIIIISRVYGHGNPAKTFRVAHSYCCYTHCNKPSKRARRICLYYFTICRRLTLLIIIFIILRTRLRLLHTSVENFENVFKKHTVGIRFSGRTTTKSANRKNSFKHFKTENLEQQKVTNFNRDIYLYTHTHTPLTCNAGNRKISGYAFTVIKTLLDKQ